MYIYKVTDFTFSYLQISLIMTNQRRNMLLNRLTRYFINSKVVLTVLKVVFMYYESTFICNSKILRMPINNCSICFKSTQVASQLWT
jgi:hypothetical protein